jgi:hypothetical protein
MSERRGPCQAAARLPSRVEGDCSGLGPLVTLDVLYELEALLGSVDGELPVTDLPGQLGVSGDTLGLLDEPRGNPDDLRGILTGAMRLARVRRIAQSGL